MPAVDSPRAPTPPTPAAKATLSPAPARHIACNPYGTLLNVPISLEQQRAVETIVGKLAAVGSGVAGHYVDELRHVGDGAILREKFAGHLYQYSLFLSSGASGSGQRSEQVIKILRPELFAIGLKLGHAGECLTIRSLNVPKAHEHFATAIGIEASLVRCLPLVESRVGLRLRPDRAAHGTLRYFAETMPALWQAADERRGLPRQYKAWMFDYETALARLGSTTMELGVAPYLIDLWNLGAEIAVSTRHGPAVVQELKTSLLEAGARLEQVERLKIYLFHGARSLMRDELRDLLRLR